MSEPTAVKTQEEDHWLSISDMMAGLMMIFLFIAISYMLDISIQQDKVREIAVTYSRLQTELSEALLDEFSADLAAWDATIDPQGLAVRFEAPEVLFETGSDTLKPGFEAILADFFPRYMAILTRPEYQADVEEIRIEGHTSSEWRDLGEEDTAYFNNMKLSQDRTRSVLRFVLELDPIGDHKEWLKAKLTANGLSSSKPVRNADESENKQASRRVEFRIRTNAEKRIVKIIEEAQRSG
jgi:outer membrane protein OmpA-like peptidoglycan-associated protein